MEENQEQNPYLLPRSCKCGGPNCNHIRGEVNHWFILHITSLTEVGIPNIPDKQVLQILPYDIDIILNAPAAIPVCGQECAQKLIARFLTNGTMKGQASSYTSEPEQER